jgi:probable HAF family extracellular repeat protein
VQASSAESRDYALVDLGTLGGSYAEAFGISSDGQVVGGSLTANDAAFHAFSWTQAGGMVDVGTLGGNWSTSADVNSSGLVIGTSNLQGSALGQDYPYHAFAWTQSSGLTDLGTFGGRWSQATAVNESGQVVGISTQVAGDAQRAFFWTRTGGIIDIGTLGGSYAQAWAINDDGYVVGSSALPGDVASHAFVWSQADGMHDLGTLGGNFSNATKINRNGQVVGYGYTSSNTDLHAFSWTAAGGMVDLGTLGGSYTVPEALSDSGQVAGSSKLTGSDLQHAFRWTSSGGMQDLGSLGDGSSAGLAIDGNGRVFGVTTTADGGQTPFVWDAAEGMSALETLGGKSNQPNAANESGQVVGGSSFPGESTEDATLWQPIAPDFVTRSDTHLTLAGQPFRPIGLNIYNANSNGSCWYSMAGNVLDDSLTAIGPSANAMRSWFFQQLATTNGARDWSAFDHTLAVAHQHGYKVIATLTDQWGDCGDSTVAGYGYKNTNWYQSAYKLRDPSGTVSYRDWVAEVVARYKNNPDILAWQLVNEPEVLPYKDADCSLVPESTATNLLSAFAADVSSLVKSIDPNHLVSLGTIGSGQCGAQSSDYASVMSIPTLDLCEFHDYNPAQLVPGDQWNGLQQRIAECGALHKPLLVGELGTSVKDVGTLQNRADIVDAKLCAQLTAGVAGVLLWAWDKNGSYNGVDQTIGEYDIGPGDPVLGALSPWTSAAHTCSSPGSPTGVIGAAGDGKASVAWLPPSSNGGSVIRSYTVQWSPGNGSRLVGGSQTSTTVSGLSNSTAYTFTVTAANAAGASAPSSTSAPVTPQAGSPTPVAATATASTATSTTVSTSTDPSTTAGVATSLVVPPNTAGGTVSIVQRAPTDASPTGYVFGGVQVDITAPAGTATNPLVLRFTITPPSGAPLDQTTLSATNIYRAEGSGTPVLIPDCTNPPDLTVYDPCVSDRRYVIVGGATDIQLTVLTSTASRWNTSRPKPQAVTVSDAGYSPSNATVQLGGTVTWTFSGKKGHTVTDSAGLGATGAPLFASRSLSSGVFSSTFGAAGTYAYNSTTKGDAFSGTISVPVTATPTSGRTTTNFSVTWATNPLTGFVFDVQYRFKAPGANGWKSWTNWITGTAGSHANFVPNQGAGTYAFHARLRNASTGRASSYSPETVTVTVSS